MSNTSWFIYNFHLLLLQTLQKDGYTISIVAPKDDYSEKLKHLGMEYHEIKMNNKGTNPIEDAKLILDFYKLYKQIAPDVILQYTIKPNIYGSMAASILRIPVISTITGLGTVFLNDSLSSKIARILYRIALRFTKKVFFLNTADRELFIKSKIIKREKTDLIPGSGINTEIFKPLESRLDNSSIKFLFIARLLKDKGIEEFVRAAQQISVQRLAFSVQEEQEIPGHVRNDVKVEFHILGAFYPGNPTAITEDEMKAWEDEGFVKYLGVSDNVQYVIAKSDCVVLPSYREGLSQVLLEASSMAKPIVATNVPGCKEVVDDGINGYLCEVKDVESLAEKMEKIITLSKDEREEMGRRGREKVMAEFDEKIVNDMYLDTLASILDGNG